MKTALAALLLLGAQATAAPPTPTGQRRDEPV